MATSQSKHLSEIHLVLTKELLGHIPMRISPSQTGGAGEGTTGDVCDVVIDILPSKLRDRQA